MSTCVACGAENPAGFRLCGRCGASLAAFRPERRKLATGTVQPSDPVQHFPYDPRHSGITWPLNSGAPGTEVSAWAGHSVEMLMRVYARCGAVVCFAALLVSVLLNSARGWWHTVGDVAILGAAAPPVVIGVAILEYRLYDIDRIISRTLAYAMVTGLMVGLYAGLVLLATQVLSFHSTIAVAASTLAAALFNPMRRRVQQVVDRRFNRARYDADQTMAAFAARLKDAVDLDSVQHDLASVVHYALEPARIGLGQPAKVTSSTTDTVLAPRRPTRP